MENANHFRDKLRQGNVMLGTAITFNDATVVEALCSLVDFVWIDMEHNALSLETVQLQIMATKGSNVTSLVRVPWNDPVLIKPVLDIGADGVIVPLIRTADDARRAVAACRYPPEGIRGFGPRRASGYGRLGGPEFCRLANESIIVAVQIEHTDAVNNLDEILAVPGLTTVLVGPNDLAGSMGYMGQPNHPEVAKVIELVIAKARRASVFIGLAVSDDPNALIHWANKGVQWLVMGADVSLMLRATKEAADLVRTSQAK